MKIMGCNTQRHVSLFVIVVFHAILLQSNNAIAEKSYSIAIDNFTQISENEIQFDLFLENTGNSFYINGVVVEVVFNPDILPEHTYLCTSGLNILPQSSDLVYPPINDYFVLSNDETRLIITSESPFLFQPAQKILSNESVKIARLQIFVFYDDMKGAFANSNSMFSFEIDRSVVQECDINESELKVGLGEVITDYKHINNDEIVTAGFCFSGKGFWHEKEGNNYVNWNNHASTHPHFANNKPNKNSNIIIAGQVTLEKDRHLSFSKNSSQTGGIIKLSTPMFEITLIPNGINASVTLSDENQQEMNNPSFVKAGASMVLKTAREGFGTGEFIHWIDQYGNVLSQSKEFSYTMPAGNIAASAVWTSGNRSSKKSDKSSSESLKSDIEDHPALIISPYASLTVERLVNAHPAGAGAILLKSESPHDIPGSFIHYEEEVAATVERFVGRHDGEHPSNQWHMIASPVNGMDIRPEFVPEGIIPPWIDLYKWDESHTATFNGEVVTGWWINSKQAGGSWNEAFEQTFQSGTGYLLAYGQPDKSYGDRAHRFQGKIRAQDLAISGLSHSSEGTYGGWHLLGNPFASAVDWNLGDWQRQHIQGGPQIWDAQWSSYSPVIHIIPAMTAFMVKTTGNGSLVIPAEARTHQAGTLAGKQWADHPSGPGQGHHESLTSNTPPHVHLRARDIEGHTAQASIILFREEATQHFDLKYDTPFMAGHAPELWSEPPAHQSGNDDPPRLALNNLPEAYDQLQVPFGFIKNEGQQFLFELLHNSTSHSLFLEDVLQHQMHALGKEKPYPFTAAKEDPSRRFILHFTDGTPPASAVDEGQHPPPRIHASRHSLYLQTHCDTCSISVFNIRGMRVIQKALREAGTHHISHHLPPGIYIAHFHCQDASGAVKVLVP